MRLLIAALLLGFAAPLPAAAPQANLTVGRILRKIDPTYQNLTTFDSRGVESAGNLGPHTEETKGKLDFLVARTVLGDPFFAKSVVLMLPSEKLPLVVGLIVNKPTHATLDKLYPEARAPKVTAADAYFGGPVDYESQSLLFHAAKAPEHAMLMYADVYLTFDPDAISTFLRDRKQSGEFRLVLGRAQWDPEQLQDEMLVGAWDRIEAEGELIFDPDGEHLWRRLHDRAQPHLDIENLLSRPIIAGEYSR